jgi:large subunit ribosomal protein L21
MKYAIIANGGKQYKVSEGQVLELDRVQADPGSDLAFDQVLMTVDGDAINLGKPFLENVSVTAKVLEQTRGDKIRVSKFKAKAKYRRTIGFRASLTKVEITGLKSKSAKKAE